MRPDSQVTLTAVESAQNNGGTAAALNALELQYTSYAQAHGGPDSRETSIYWNAVVQGLKNDGLFDAIAVAWGREQLNAYTKKGLGWDDLQEMYNTAPGPLIRDMTGSLIRHYDELKFSHRDHKGFLGSKERDAVTADDLSDQLVRIEDQRQARFVISNLMQSVNGQAENTLFGKIDRCNKVDGKIGIKDINDYVARKTDEYNHGAFSQDSPEAAQERADLQYAMWLQQGWDTDPEILKLRGVSYYANNDPDSDNTPVYNRYLTLDGLAISGGYRNSFDMLSTNLNQQIQSISSNSGADKVESQERPSGSLPPEKVDHANPKEVVPSVDNLLNQLSGDATQREGEGPWHAAARLLPGAGNTDVMQLTHALKRSYQQQNSDNTDKLVKLPVGYVWLNRDNVVSVIKQSQAFQKRLAALPHPAAPPAQ